MLLGPYGFLTDFSCQPEALARRRVALMHEVMGIREFQFYDWFADYSTPVRGRRWKDPFFRRREICRDTIEVYLDEIHRRGGRAWAYVQSVGSERKDLPHARLLDSKGKWYWHAGRFPTYF